LRTVASTRLLDFTSEAIIRQTRRHSAVKALHVQELSMRRAVGVIRRNDGYLPPLVRRMLDTLKTVAKSQHPEARPSQGRRGANSQT
jgi:hypothetical protein